MFQMPVLTGPRLTIRPFVRADLPAVLDVFDHVTPGTTPDPAVLARRSAWLQWVSTNHDELARLDQPPYGDRAVVLTATGTLIGAVGLVPCIDDFGNVGIGPADGRTTAEVGLFWMIHPDHRRHGYATEAARLLVHFAIHDVRLDRIIATTDHDNVASQGVMRKLGMDLRRNDRETPPWLQTVGVYEAWMEPAPYPDGTVIRAMSEADLPEMLALWNAAGLRLSPTDTPAGMRRHNAFSGRFALVLCSGDGAIIGTLLGSYDGRRGWVNHLAVHPAHQHRGYAARLIAALRQRLRSVGCEKLNLLVVQKNAQVVPFYEKLGFAVDNNLFMAQWLTDD